ncbi:DUF5723 family protein [uncultured Roseivirga sp.]|uniref:DUF5723 family protein n=1 Tax=uncultured Roseivirga sp. TaxID=543088 RepID=UPI0030DD9A17
MADFVVFTENTEWLKYFLEIGVISVLQRNFGSILRFTLAFLTLLLPQLIMGQSFNGYMHSDFSGIIGAQLQPANLAGSPYKYDISLVNANYFLTNNIAYIKSTETSRGFVRYLNDGQRFLHSNIALGGISGMATLRGDESVGFTYRMRAHGSAIDFSPEFITQMGRFTQPQFLNSQATNQSGKFATALWREYGLTYAKILKDDGFHRWKAGATFKLINPRGSAFLDIQDISYSTDNSGNTDLTNAELAFGYSANLNSFEQFDGTEKLDRLPDLIGNHFGFDFGVVYERVSYWEASKDENGTNRNRDIDYEFKLSASITDIGMMKFQYGSASTQSTGLLGNVNAENLDTLFSGIASFRGVADSLATVAQTSSLNGEYTVSLPTTLNLGYDYNFGNDYYLGAFARIDLTSLSKADYRLNYQHSLTISPRWEKEKKAIYAPLYINQQGAFHLGLAARYGPITLGTQSLGSLLSSEPNTGSFFFSININQLKANAKKPYCFGPSRGTSMTNTKRTPIYKRKKWIFF